MILKFCVINLLIFANLILHVSSLCDNVKSVCDCQQQHDRTSIKCPKINAGGQYTHHIEIKDQQYFTIDCIKFHPLSKVPKLSYGWANITHVEFKNCFNNDTRHPNYQFNFGQFMNYTVDGRIRNVYHVSFQDLGKVNETLFFDRWPLLRSKVAISNIYLQSNSLPTFYGLRYLGLINTNLVDFDKFDVSYEMENLEIKKARTIRNFNTHNLRKFRKLKYLNIENSTIDDYYGQMFVQCNIFDDIRLIEKISFRSTFTDYMEKIVINERIFYNLNVLSTLKLIDLKLEELPETLFKDLTMLSDLSLRQNKLSSLNKNIFSNCQQLITIDLAYNNFIRIDATVFKVLYNLNYLTLSHNLLQSFLFDASYHPFFKKIYLDHNHIHMDSFTCPIINIHDINGMIDYSYNEITRSEPILDCLIKNPTIRELYVNHNQIESLQMYDFFSNYFLDRRNITLLLENNLIGYIDLLEHDSLSSTRNVTIHFVLLLDSNPIFCDDCLYGVSQFTNTAGVNFKHNNIEFQILSPQNCIRSIYCPISELVGNYSCPSTCYCTFNEYFKSLSINCENNALTEIPFLSDDLLYGISIAEIRLNLQNNKIANISFDSLNDGGRTSLSVIRKITTVNLEHNTVEILKFHREHFPTELKTLKLAWNKIAKIDDTTLELMNKRKSLLSVTLGNNTITNDPQLYERYIKQIKFTLADREGIDEEFNHHKLEARIRDSRSNTVSIIMVSLVFMLMTFGLVFAGYMYHTNHKKHLTQTQSKEPQRQMENELEPTESIDL